MPIDAFADKRMKILYALSFMRRGMAQVWAANETSMVLANTLTFNTLEGLLALIERTFGGPDKERTTRAQLHALRMTPGITAKEYTANFKMISGRTGFNDTVLEDAYVRGLPQSILLKVYSQTSLPSGMDNWKAVVCNLDCLQKGYTELKQSIRPNRVPFPQTNTPAATQTPDTSMPMDIDKNKHRSETCSCYNCNENGHISRHCPKPRKQQIQSTESTKLDLKSLVAKAVVAAVDAREIGKKAEEPKEGF